MFSAKDSSSSSGGRNFMVFVWGVVGLAVVLLLIMSSTNMLDTDKPGEIPDLLWLVIAAVLSMTMLVFLWMIYRRTERISDYNVKLETVAEAVKKNRQALEEMEQSLKVSDRAKAIAFHNSDVQLLRNMVFDALEQKDFDSAEQMINKIADHEAFSHLAEQLRDQMNKYHDSTEGKLVDEAIAEVESLLDAYEWIKASNQIEELIEKWPQADRVKELRQRLSDKKHARKKVLLNAWDDAVQRKATDRSLEILRELDQYLTPNEGLALQETARDVFKDKLHNLGMQFSTAVSTKSWAKALELGRQISRDFPNSTIAEEIREKMDFLQAKGAEQVQQ
jgi:hypothetical protein